MYYFEVIPLPKILIIIFISRNIDNNLHKNHFCPLYKTGDMCLQGCLHCIKQFDITCMRNFLGKEEKKKKLNHRIIRFQFF